MHLLGYWKTSSCECGPEKKQFAATDPGGGTHSLPFQSYDSTDLIVPEVSVVKRHVQYIKKDREELLYFQR